MSVLRGRRTLLLSLPFLFASVSPLYAEVTAPVTAGALQGDVAAIEIPISRDMESLSGVFDGREVPILRKDGEGGFMALLGIDLDTKPGVHSLEVTAERNGAIETLSYQIRVIKKGFKVQRLKLPKEMVDLDEETLKRVALESERLEGIFRNLTPERFWDDDFILPLDGRVSGAFGLRRIINKKPRSPHSGMDIAAASGEMVMASNRGRVVLAAEHFLSGKTVVLDHGLGLYTMYFHLSEISVEEGEFVEKRDVVGLVGSTGRSTGPHLHWGVTLSGVRVNPLSLVALGKGEKNLTASKGVDASGSKPARDIQPNALGEPE